jgi:hypothetical protein
MSSEWGWWTARGRYDHIQSLKQKYEEEAKQGNRPLNFGDCASEYAELVDMPSEELDGQLDQVFMNDFVNFSNNTWNPSECGQICKEEEAGCECKKNDLGNLVCKFWCDGGDELRGGLYMDKCGLPRKVTRCPGFQQLISCERAFKEQMIELLDNKHSRSKISIAAQCMACRSNSIVSVARGKFPVEVEVFLTKKIALVSLSNADLERIRGGGGNLSSVPNETAASSGNTAKIGVDVMWLFDGVRKTEWDINSLTKAPEWELVFVTYRMPRAGTWDTNYYESMFGSLFMTKDKAQAQMTELSEITVALLPNDPRLKEIENQLIFENAHRDRKSTWKRNNVNSRDVAGVGGGNVSSGSASAEIFAGNHPMSDAFSGATRCNIMFGYTGRLCRECTAGFTMSKKECVRCGPYATVMSAAILGSFLGLIIVMFVVLMVVHDAGSSSVSTVMKRILINHLQTVALLMNFDLNWTPNLMSAFEFASSVSSVGDDLIQLGCPLSTMYHQCKSDPSQCGLPMDSLEEPMRPFYVGQMFFFLMPVIFMIPGAIYMVVTHYVCHAKALALEKNEAKGEDLQRTIANLKNLRSKQMKAQNTEEGRKNYEETRRLRTEYNMLLAELHKSGFHDVEALSGVVADHHAIGRLRARDFVQHCNRNHIHLENLFREFDPDHTGSIAVSDFMLIVDNTLGEGAWSEEDKLCVSELFAGDHDDDPETEDRVQLTRLLSFGKTLLDRLVVMMVTVCFLVYPTIARKVFQSISCISNLDDGPSFSYLTNDLSVPCDSVAHIMYVLFVPLPVLILFVIGFPVVILLFVLRSIKKHKWMDETTTYRYAVFVSGYRKDHWYWEVIVCMRKVLLSMISVFMGQYGPELQFFFASLLLVSCMVMHIDAKPFANKQLNTIETAGLGILFLSLYNGMFFFWNLLDEDGLNVLAWITISVNIYYAFWVMGAVCEDMLHRHPLGKKVVGRCYNYHSSLSLVILSGPFCLILLGLMFHSLVTCKCLKHQKAHMEREAHLHEKTSALPADLLRRQNMALRDAMQTALQEVDTEEARARRAARAMGKKTQGIFSSLISAAATAALGSDTVAQDSANKDGKTPTKVVPVPASGEKEKNAAWEEFEIDEDKKNMSIRTWDDGAGETKQKESAAIKRLEERRAQADNGPTDDETSWL